jgi:hypothetical protein
VGWIFFAASTSALLPAVSPAFALASDRLVELLQLEIGQAAIVIGIDQRGVALDGLGVVGEGALVVALVAAGVAASVVDRCRIRAGWIALV